MVILRAQSVHRILQEALDLATLYRQRRERISREEKQSRARWDLLAAIGSGRRTVPSIARQIGLSRQGVQRIADLLVEARLARFEPNPDHRRSPMLAPTEEGLRLRDRLERKLQGWELTVEELVEAEDLETALVVLRAIRSGLER
jgi:DNA-binding MarR family transcriptional regulator